MPFAVFGKADYANQEYVLEAICETEEEAKKVSEYILCKFPDSYVEHYGKFVIPKDRLYKVFISPDLKRSSCYETNSIDAPKSRIGQVREIDEYKKVEYVVGLSHYEAIVSAENEKVAKEKAARLVEKHIEKQGARNAATNRRDFDVTCRRLAEAWKKVPNKPLGEFLTDAMIPLTGTTFLTSDKDFIKCIEDYAEVWADNE